MVLHKQFAQTKQIKRILVDKFSRNDLMTSQTSIAVYLVQCAEWLDSLAKSNQINKNFHHSINIQESREETQISLSKLKCKKEEAFH